MQQRQGAEAVGDVRRMLANELTDLKGQASQSLALHAWLTRRTPVVSSWLTGLLADDTALDRFAKDGYVHANGFFKLPILATSTGVLRLHVWTEQSTPGNVHNHRWPLASVILAGSLEAEIFAPSDEGQAFDAFRYTPSSDTAQENLVPVGTQTMATAGGFVASVRGSYHLPAMTLHRARARLPGTVSLMLRGTAIGLHTSVMSQQGTDPEERPSTKIDVDRIRRALEQSTTSRDEAS